MSFLRSKSSDKLKARKTLPPEERETLLPCEACAGKGTYTFELGVGRYKMKQCRWCQGVGCVPKLMLKAYVRWQRILRFNRMQGACGVKAQD